MRISQWISVTVSTLLLTAPLHAQKLPEAEVLQMPVCLASNLSTEYPILAQNKQFKILEVPSSEVEKIVLLADKLDCGRFINLTHLFPKQGVKQEQAKKLLETPQLKKTVHETYELQHQEEVFRQLENVSTDKIMATLKHLTSYYNRSASQPLGEEVAQWLKAEFEKMAADNHRDDTHTYLVKTNNYKQPSVVTVIGKDLEEPGIVIGAHMDTLDGRMPGAGDDGSGSSSIMEVARVLLESDIRFNRPIYIIWYAAEERGLIGSQHVVQHFKSKKIPVKAAIQFDMTGYRPNANDPTMWVYQDYTDAALNKFVSELIQVYVQVPVSYSKCGYGCSDHASWTKIGVPAAFPCESNFRDHNPYIHTSKDTMDILNSEHMTNFTKLGLAYAIELAME